MTQSPELKEIIANEIVFQRVLNVVESRRNRPSNFITPCELFDETDALMLNLRLRHRRIGAKVPTESGGKRARNRNY